MNKVKKTEDVSLNQDKWFEELIASIRVDQLQLDSGVASDSKKGFYQTMMEGNTLKLAQIGRETSTQQFVLNIVKDYFEEFKSRKIKPLHLGLELNDASILVWAEINDEDEQAERDLILAEAMINAKYSSYGFYISSTIVEKSDRLSVPSHYQKVK